EAGLVEGQDYSTTYRNAQGDIATLNAIFDELAGDDTDLIVSFSTPCLQAAVRKIDGKPIVFALVLDPFAAGAGKTDTDHRQNVPGASLLSPYAEMAKTVQQIPPRARKVGTLFAPAEINSVLAQRLFAQALEKTGRVLTSAPVSSPAEVSDAALSL